MADAATFKTKNFVASPMRKAFPDTPLPGKAGKLIAALSAAGSR